MITAEHWVNQQFSKQIISEDIYASKQGIIEAMVIFAKLHVEAALKEAIKQLPVDDKLNKDIFVMEKIINCYPLTNIK